MQKRTRRPHGIGSRKISVSITEADLKLLTARARSVHGGNVSAVLHDLVESARREAAMDRLIRRLGADRIPDSEVDAVRAEIRDARPARAKRGRAA